MEWSIGLVVIGWIVSHALTLRAQTLQQKTAVRNEARLAVSAAIRPTQRWLRAVMVERASLESAGEPPEWAPVLEEYWAVFPRLRWIHGELLDRYAAIVHAVGAARKLGESLQSETRREAGELVGLFEDVLILIQAWALSPLFRTKVPERTPSPGRPFVRARGRQLIIDEPPPLAKEVESPRTTG